MGNCKSIAKQEVLDCPICYEQMKRGCDCRTQYGTLISPCCRNKIHRECWTKCLNINGKCPLCRHKHIPDDYMDNIKYSQNYYRNVLNIHDMDYILSTTYVWCRRGRDCNLIGNDDVICFTDNLYWHDVIT